MFAIFLISLRIKKQRIKFSSVKIKKKSSKPYHNQNSKTRRQTYKPTHQDLQRLSIYLFSSLALKELITVCVCVLLLYFLGDGVKEETLMCFKSLI